jgi:hypothetical protein
VETVRKGKTAGVVVWDTAVYNHLTKKWEREGRRLTRRQADNRKGYRTRSNPHAQFKVVKVVGRRTNAERNGVAK